MTSSLAYLRPTSMSVADNHHNPSFIHHQKTLSSALVREVVFGIEDGMVSTMGAVTGIAAATVHHYTVVLAGLVIISVESISMAVGSYLSSKSEREIEERKLHEERSEIKDFPREEEEELAEMYVHDGWPAELAEPMAKAAASNHSLLLQEMAYRELKIIPEKLEHPLSNALAMGVSYIIGSLLSLLPYLFINNVLLALPVAIVGTLVGLFIIGIVAARFARRSWWKGGLEMLVLASAAGFIGYIVGQAADKAIVH